MSFRFKEFSIEQDSCAMKVGTDGVLLGAWVHIKGDERYILDIGTGTGLIAIMAAQRAPLSSVVGVEIETSAARQAAENATRSKWAQRVSIVECSIQEYYPAHAFDLIISNPPYFVDSLLAKGEERTTARHTTTLSFDDLARAAARLLCSTGRFALILPPTESCSFEVAAQRCGLYLVRRCSVFGREGGALRRIMSEYSPTQTKEVEQNEIAIRATPPEEYSKEYRDLTKGFYLRF